MGIVAERGELRFLHAAEAASGIEDEHVHAVKAVEGVGDGAAAVAGGGHEHADAAAAVGAGGQMAVETRQETRAHILERQRRPVEQFQDEDVAGDAAQGNAEIDAVGHYLLEHGAVHVVAE